MGVLLKKLSRGCLEPLIEERDRLKRLSIGTGLNGMVVYKKLFRLWAYKTHSNRPVGSQSPGNSQDTCWSDSEGTDWHN